MTTEERLDRIEALLRQLLRHAQLPRDRTVARVDEHGVAYNAAGESIGITGTTGPVCGHEPKLRFFGEVPL